MAKGKWAVFKPEYCQMLTDHIAKGGTAKSFSQEIGYSYAVVYKWILRREDFRAARDEGRRRFFRERPVDAPPPTLKPLAPVPMAPVVIPDLVIGNRKAF